MVFVITILMPLTLAMLTTSVLNFSIRNLKVKKYVLTGLFLWVWLLATPAFSFLLATYWEGKTRPVTTIDDTVQAIVILGGGLYEKADEYGGKIVINENTLVRLHYGAHLYKKKAIPIMVAGGDSMMLGGSEGQEMAELLEHYYGIAPKWSEKKSANTYFNAKFSAEILHKEGVRKVYLVTQSWHMPRASLIFKRCGFDVLEAPTGFFKKSKWGLIDFIPTAEGIAKTSLLTKEMIGWVYYNNCEICHES